VKKLGVLFSFLYPYDPRLLSPKSLFLLELLIPILGHLDLLLFPLLIVALQNVGFLDLFHFFFNFVLLLVYIPKSVLVLLVSP